MRILLKTVFRRFYQDHRAGFIIFKTLSRIMCPNNALYERSFYDKVLLFYAAIRHAIISFSAVFHSDTKTNFLRK